MCEGESLIEIYNFSNSKRFFRFLFPYLVYKDASYLQSTLTCGQLTSIALLKKMDNLREVFFLQRISLGIDCQRRSTFFNYIVKIKLSTNKCDQ